MDYERISGDSQISSTPSVQKTKVYMDSLIPPSRDKFEQIAQVQKEKESEARRKAKDHVRQASSSSAKEEQDQAARVIQKTFRGYRLRRELEGYGLNASTRWVTAVREAQFRQTTKPRAASGAVTGEMLNLDDPVDYRPVTARQKWKKASLVARHAGHDDTDSDSSSDSESDSPSPEDKEAARRRRVEQNTKRRQAARMMGLQYFLEMVDSKHRYGSNLRMYHAEWKKSDTTQNFFYWLDYGEGNSIELDTCPRDRLDRERVRYLSREERQYYLTKVDSDGRLCWVKNGARIDTTEDFKDSIHGIVPVDDPTPDFRTSIGQHPHLKDESGAESDSGSSMESKREADRAAKYVDPGVDDNKGVKKVTHLSASTIFNQLLRKSVKKNTWIFVADTSFRLYVGIKDSGAFQHSSFLQGSRISAAGLVKIKNGRLSSLSPLSGHYRPPASNFRAFVKNLKEIGVDMSHVSISKSYTILVGLETYVKTRRKGKKFVEKMIHGKNKIVDPEEVKRQQEAAKDTSESAEKERKFLENQRLEEEAAKREQSTSTKVAEKLKSIPSHAKVQESTA